jgi:uncharacterized protein YcbK (DUF882 family)
MKYFTIKELTHSNTADAKKLNNTPTPEVEKNLIALVEHILDPLREKWGKPIKVNCGYRSPAVNKAVGGVANSQHVLGQAADITTGTKESNKKLYELIKTLKLPVDQCIWENGGTWVHISYGPRNRRQFFNL